MKVKPRKEILLKSGIYYCFTVKQIQQAFYRASVLQIKKINKKRTRILQVWEP